MENAKFENAKVKYVCRKCKWSKIAEKPVTKCGDCGGKHVVKA